MENNSQDDVVAFCTDFSKAIDRVPHFEPINKIAGMGVGGFMLKILSEYLEDQSQDERVGTTNFTRMYVTVGVPQSSILVPLLFCLFINNLHETQKISSLSLLPLT